MSVAQLVRARVSAMVSPASGTKVATVPGKGSPPVAPVFTSGKRPVSYTHLLPAVILDGVPGVTLDQTFYDQSVGVIDIKSVYDFDGVDTAVPNIQTLANPAKTKAAQRPARFIRLQKAVSLPDMQTLNIADQAFGASSYMREILEMCIRDRCRTAGCAGYSSYRFRTARG